MPDSVILTVRDDKGRVEHDMELPADVPVGELCGRLLAALKNMDYEAFGSRNEIMLRVHPGGRTLGAEETLETAEVWDGSELVIETVG